VNRTGTLTVAGLLIGSLTLGTFVFLYALTPLVPLALAGATAISPRSRPFAWGALAAAAGTVVFLVIAGVTMSVVGPGVEVYSP
jgi:hypothetical protein